MRAVPREVSADAGYYSVKAVEELYALGANPFIAPEKTRHGRVLEPAHRGRIPKGLSVRDRMRRKLRTKRGRERCALRMETVEPVFGQIKQGRGLPAVPAAGSGEGEPGMAAHLRRPQPAEAVPFRGRDLRQCEGQRRHWEQQGVVPGHGQWGFRDTTRICPSAPRRICSHRGILADQQGQLVNPQTGS